MNLIIERADVWAARLDDRSGGLADLLKPLKDVGADFDFIIARRSAEDPGKGVVFVTPLRGEREVGVAAEVGFNVASSIHSVRIQGQNQPGVAADIAEILAKGGLTMRGFSAAELGTRFVMFIGMDSEADADNAVEVLRQECQLEEFSFEESAA